MIKFKKNKIKLNWKILKFQWTWVGLEPTRVEVLFPIGASSLH